MTRDVYNALKPDVGPKVEDFVDAAMGMIRHEMNDELRSMGDKVKELEQSYGEFFAWVNCAYPRTSDWDTPLEEVSIISWQQNVNMHLNSYCIISKEIAKRMASRGIGSIV